MKSKNQTKHEAGELLRGVATWHEGTGVVEEADSATALNAPYALRFLHRRRPTKKLTRSARVRISASLSPYLRTPTGILPPAPKVLHHHMQPAPHLGIVSA